MDLRGASFKIMLIFYPFLTHLHISNLRSVHHDIKCRHMMSRLTMNGKVIEDGRAYEVYTSQKEIEKIQKKLNDKVLVNSIAKKLENGNTSAQPILIDTASFNREELQEYIAISEKIERLMQLNKSCQWLNNPTPLKAIMTQEELFECPFDNDHFYMALEDANLFGPRQITDLDASNSSENATQSNDENVNADIGPSRGATPTKLPCTDSVITSFKTQMSNSLGSPPPPYQELDSAKSCCEKTEPEVPTRSTEELRKKNEQCMVAKEKPQEKAHESKDQRKSDPPVPPTTTSKSKQSPNLPRKPNVKQLVQLFDSKISQLMCHDSTEKKYSKSSIAKPALIKPQQVEELYISKLTVVFKPTPKRGGCLPKQRIPPRPLLRKLRKRCHDTVTSMSFDTYGPPKKIHRTWIEDFQPKAIIRNLQIGLFCDWIIEKYVLSFDITTVENSEDSFTNADEANTAKCLVKLKLKPPENELQKSHDHNSAALSEHQLRVQASLQRLNIPDWFRQYNQNTSRSPEGNTTAYKPGNFTRKRTTESGRWAGLNSKTTSLSSLGSQRSDRSPLLLSPSAHSHHGGQVVQQPGATTTSAYGTGGGAGAFSRWSTSHLNSSQTSPSVSQRGSFTRGGPINSSFISVASGQSSVIRSSYRQPYLGWRSTEKLSQRTPHERLASSLIAQQQRTSPTQRNASGAANGDNGKLLPVTPEIQSSIKEVTSAIVHYVNDQTQQQQRSRSASPNSRKCWLESSFVGIRPLDSPQTPVIENTATAFSSATNTNNSVSSSQYNNYNYNYNYNTNNSSSNTLTAITTPNSVGGIGITTAITTNPHVLRMNGLSIVGGAPERSLSTASLEDVLASLLGLPSSSASSGGVQGVNVGAGAGAGVGASVGVGVNVNAGPSSTSEPYARSTTTGDSASQSLVTFRHMPQQLQQPQNPQSQLQLQQSQQQLLAQLQAEQQRLRRRSEGDAPQQQKQQQPSLHNQNAKTNSSVSNTIGLPTHTNAGNYPADGNATVIGGGGTGSGSCVIGTGNATLSTRRVSLGDSSESNNKTTSELQIKCRNTKCDRSATPADAKKYYKSCHNCTHLYCSRECRRAHWEKHRKACLHSRASNLCRQVLATCKDDVDSQRHLSLLARKGFLSQGRGVVRVLFRSAEAAESFIKHGFQCMGEASYVRWPDLMPAEMGLELYSELLKLSTEYKPDSKMLIYVAICVVSEAPGMGQAPVRWERQLVSRCAKLKLCKSILAELEQQLQALQQQQPQPPLTVVAVPEPTTEILILTFNPSLRSNANQGELILSNILDILSRRGVLLRKHYPEIYQRLQTYTDGQTEKFNPVTLHPRDSQTGKSFVCIIMPVYSSDSDVIKLPSASDGGNRVTTIDVGSPAALAQLDDDELLTRSTS
ncbi:uncharacterized protein LOC128862741 isoform X1 [Anastrepha ludens]|uniref:uncharacterized protein LOC128862741 isoform X1 n=1 Tax=Anastrepha ludens TaxID=28586 RepID=UPI0023AF6577|nr:uncharacterized protein LOC128862741 isoform X1 [Anastrepha ludens]